MQPRGSQRVQLAKQRQVLRDARKEGRLRQELSEQAKEGRGKVKELWHKYGAVGIGCYIGIYFGTVGILYVVYDYGVMTSMPSGGAAVIEKVSYPIFYSDCGTFCFLRGQYCRWSSFSVQSKVFLKFVQ